MRLGFSQSQAEALLKNKDFVLIVKGKSGQEFAEVFKTIKTVYGATKGQVAKAVFSHPRFAGYNHSRVVRQAVRLGRIIGLGRKKIIKAILDRPVLASYSQRRNLAAIDAFRNALGRTGSVKTNRKLFELYKKIFMESPYPVKGSKKRETWWQRRKQPVTVASKMGLAVEKKLRKARRPR